MLDEDASISIEEQSPLWGDGNEFSFPFELSIEENRHIVGNSDQLTGQSIYDVLHGQRAVLYAMGIPIFYGKVEIDDEVEIAEGRVEVNIVSGNKSFQDMIDGMNCQDVEITDRIEVGERWSDFDVNLVDNNGKVYNAAFNADLPPGMMTMSIRGKSTVNIDKPYPQMPYCNTRICYQIPEKPTESENTQKGLNTKHDENIIRGRYISLDAARPMSGLCFYVLYFMDLLFKQLGIQMDLSEVKSIEDMNRLAFFSTKCDVNEEDWDNLITDDIYKYRFYTIWLKNKVAWGATDIEDDTINVVIGNYPTLMFMETSGNRNFSEMRLNIHIKKCLATSKNFPDVDVSDFIDAFQNGFGMRFLFDKEKQSGRAIFLKDILKSNEIIDIQTAEVYDAVKAENHINGFSLSYSGASDDDTSYNYNDWENIEMIRDYGFVQAAVNMFNKKLYVDENSGNAYRIKVEGEAANKEEAYPALFEVGAFNKVSYGDSSDDELTESVEIGFTPITMNDVNAEANRKKRRSDFREDTVEDEVQTLSVFCDVSMEYPEISNWIEVAGVIQTTDGELWPAFKYAYATSQKYDYTYTDQSRDAIKENYRDLRYDRRHIKYITPLAYENVSPISAMDTGLTFGLMRGPGRDAGVEDFSENYDDENNFRYTLVGQDYAFSSDTCDNYGHVFDYNGTEEGGVDMSGRFSLKLRAEKPVGTDGALQTLPAEYAKRGLFDRFYTEYAYFVVNRKIVKLTVSMEIADLVNIDWTKRYKIGDYTGFINKVNYTVDSTGIGDVEIEMYYI